MGGSEGAGVAMNLAFILTYVAFTMLVLAVVIDVRRNVLPNRLTYPAIALALVAAWAGGTMPDALTGMAVIGGVMLALLMTEPTGVGGGDVKMATAAGLLVGWGGLIPAIVGMIVGSIVALVVMRLTGRRSIAFGPVLLAGCAAGMIGGT